MDKTGTSFVENDNAERLALLFRQLVAGMPGDRGDRQRPSSDLSCRKARSG